LTAHFKLTAAFQCERFNEIANRLPLRYNTPHSMSQNQTNRKPDMHSEEFLHSLMRKQLKLSIACALAFLVVLLGLPLANYFAPELMAKRIFGFTLTWFLLGIGFFPAVWCISFYFIKRSIALEEEEAAEVQPDNPSKS
jgi:uncharacterized membrane protein (DUF485 family)